MKKFIFGALIVIGVLIGGLMIVRGQDLYRNNHYSQDQTTEDESDFYAWMHDDDTYGHMGYGMMGRNYGSYGACHGYDQEEEQATYEFLYSHLSLEDQDKIDVLYAEMLDDYDFTTMTETEKLEAIESIKDTLVDEILENYSRGW
ncbi:hypothetical protein KHQ88_02730 [Mycoplasmatota bacterium]|nr:hypothetical protein KHQ88_02730 [Mycoplasmatota bacterium]